MDRFLLGGVLCAISLGLVSCNSDPIVVPQANELSGQVVDPNGQPIVGATANFMEYTSGGTPTQVDSSTTQNAGDFNLVFPRHGGFSSNYIVTVPGIEGITFYGFGISDNITVNLVSTAVYELMANSPAPVEVFTTAQIQQLLADATTLINKQFTNELIQLGNSVTTKQLLQAYENAISADTAYITEWEQFASADGYNVIGTIPFGKVDTLPVIETFLPKAATGNVTEEQTMAFSISSLDHDNYFLFYDWSYQKVQSNCGQSNEIDAGPQVHSLEGDFSYTFKPDYSFSSWQQPNTTYKVTATVSDGGLYSQQIWCVNVANLERAPTFTTSPTTTSTEDVAWSYTPVATSIEGAPFNVSLVTGSFPSATNGYGGMDMCINVAPIGTTPAVWQWQVAGTPCFTPNLITWTPDNCESTGPQFVSLQAVDIVNAIGYQSFNVQISEVNTAPTITSSPPGAPTPSAVEAVAWSYQVTATDPQAETAAPGVTGSNPSPYNLAGGKGCPDSLTFSFAQSPPSATIDSHTGLINWTPQDSETGIITFVVVVSDGHGGTAQQSFTVNTERTELPPAFNNPLAGSTYTVNEEQYTATPFTLQFSSTDPNIADFGTFSISNMPADATFTITPKNQLPTGQASGGLFSWPITDYDVPTTGLSQPMTITLCDANKAGLPLSDPAPALPIYVVSSPYQHYCTTGTVTLNAPKRNIGTIFTSSPRTLATGNTQYTYPVTVQDGNVNPPDTLTFSLVGGSGCTVPSTMSFSSSSHITTITPSSTVVAGEDTAGVTIYWTPNNNTDLGMHCFNIQVSDANAWPGDPHTTTQAVQVFVQEQAVTPTLSLSSCGTAAQNGTTYTCQAQGSTTNVTSPNNVLTYSLSAAPNGMTIDPTSGLISWDPSVAQAEQGSASATVIVTNGASPPLSAQQVLNLTLTHVDVPPNLVPVANQIIPTGQPYSLTVYATDPNGYAINFPTPSGLPSGATWTDNGNGTATMTWTPTSNGTITMTVTAENTAMLTASENIQIQTTNGPIFLSHGVLSANVGKQYSYEVHCLDPAGQGLTYTFTNSPNGMTVQTDSTTHLTTVTWTPTSGQAGNQDIVLTATDGAGHTASQEFYVYVNVGTNTPPNLVSTSPPYTSTAIATELTSGNFTVNATDTSGYVLHYAWYLDGTWVYDASSTYTYIPDGTAAGNHTLLAVVTDGASTIDVTFNVHVRNAMPVITSTYTIPASKGTMNQFVVMPKAGELVATTASPNNYLIFGESTFTSGPSAQGNSALPFAPQRIAIRNDYSTTNFLMGYFAALGGISAGGNSYATMPSDTLNWSTCSTCFTNVFNANDYVMSGGTNEVYLSGTRYNINPSARNMLSSNTNGVDNPDVSLGATVHGSTLALDAADQLIFVADTANNQIVIFSTSSNSVSTTVSLPAGTNPGALYFNANTKKLYVYGSGAGSITEIIVGSNQISYTTTGLPNAPSLSDDPPNILTGNDADSLLFLANTDNNMIVIIDELSGTYQKASTNDPSEVGFDSNTMNTFFSSYLNNTINEVQ